MGRDAFHVYLSPFLDVLIVYYLIYRVLLIIKGTRAVPMLFGLVLIGSLYILSQEAYLGLSTFSWLFDQFIGSLFLIVIVLFQTDIRRALAAVGKAEFLTSFRSEEGAQIIDELVKATSSLATQRIGALIAIERDADLSPYMEDSVKLDSRVSKELIYSIFVPERQNPLHDGAIVLRRGRIVAAGVFLPMSVNPKIDRAFGTRHRAALGLSEETDALVLVVSEERGAVSLAREGQIERDISSTVLRQRLTDLLIKRTGRIWDKGIVAALGGRRRDSQKGKEL